MDGVRVRAVGVVTAVVVTLTIAMSILGRCSRAGRWVNLEGYR